MNYKNISKEERGTLRFQLLGAILAFSLLKSLRKMQPLSDRLGGSQGRGGEGVYGHG
jgi:hypothetical protein